MRPVLVDMAIRNSSMSVRYLIVIEGAWDNEDERRTPMSRSRHLILELRLYEWPLPLLIFAKS